MNLNKDNDKYLTPWDWISEKIASYFGGLSSLDNLIESLKEKTANAISEKGSFVIKLTSTGLIRDESSFINFLMVISCVKNILVFNEEDDFVIQRILDMLELTKFLKIESKYEIKCSFKMLIFDLKSPLVCLANKTSYDKFNFCIEKLYKGLYFNYYDKFSGINSLNYIKRKSYDNKLATKEKLEKLSNLSLFSLDIDAIYGCVEIGNLYEIFECNITISFYKKCLKSIYNKTDFIYIENHFFKVGQATSIYIGTMKTNMGIFSIFLMTKSKTKENLETKFISMIKNWTQRNEKLQTSKSLKITETSINGAIYNKDLSLIESYLAAEMQSELFFIETYGNKNSTVVSFDRNENYNKVVNDLMLITTRSLNIYKGRYLKIDICVSVDAKKNTITLPSDNFINRIGFKPSHVLFFDKRFRNFNSADNKLEKECMRFNSGMLKHNFYTTLKNNFYNEKSRVWPPKLSFSILTSAFFTKVWKLNKSNRYKVEQKKVEEIGKNFHRNITDSYPYRCEITIRPYLIYDFFSELMQLINESDWYVLESESTNKVLLNNVKIFKDLLVPPKNINDLHDAFILENLLFEGYLYGRNQLSYPCKKELSANINQLRASCVLPIVDTKTIIFFLDFEQSQNKIRNLIDMAFKIKEWPSDFIKVSISNILNAHFCSQKNLMQIIVNQYFEDMKIRARIDEDCKVITNYKAELSLYQQLNNDLEFVSILDLFNHIVKYAKKKTSACCCYILTNIQKGKFDFESLLNDFRKEFIARKICYAYRLTLFKKRPAEKSKLKDSLQIFLDYDQLKHETYKLTVERKKEFAVLKSLIPKRFYRNRNRMKYNYSLDLRMIHGYQRYKNTTQAYQLIANDLLYGLFPILTKSQIRQRIRVLRENLPNTSYFQELIEASTKWIVESFTVDQREEEMKNYGFELSLEAMSLYYKILERDIKIYKNLVSQPKSKIKPLITVPEVEPKDVYDKANFDLSALISFDQTANSRQQNEINTEVMCHTQELKPDLQIQFDILKEEINRLKLEVSSIKVQLRNTAENNQYANNYSLNIMENLAEFNNRQVFEYDCGFDMDNDNFGNDHNPNYFDSENYRVEDNPEIELVADNIEKNIFVDNTSIVRRENRSETVYLANDVENCVKRNNLENYELQLNTLLRHIEFGKNDYKLALTGEINENIKVVDYSKSLLNSSTGCQTEVAGNKNPDLICSNTFEAKIADDLLAKIKRKYHQDEFTLAEIRKNCYKNKSRPPNNALKSVFNFLVENGVLESKFCFSRNTQYYKVVNPETLATYSKEEEEAKAIYAKLVKKFGNGSIFCSVSARKSMFNISKRPSYEKWNVYLTILCNLHIIVKIINFSSKKNLFKLL